MVREVRGVDAVHEASDAFAALEEAAEFRPDFVVLDIHMPGRSGIDLLNDIAQLATRPQTLVVLTNDPSDIHRRECLARGAHHFLDKSTDVGRVLDILGSAIRDARRVKADSNPP